MNALAAGCKSLSQNSAENLKGKKTLSLQFYEIFKWPRVWITVSPNFNICISAWYNECDSFWTGRVGPCIGEETRRERCLCGRKEAEEEWEVWEVETRALFLCMLQLQPSPRLFVWAWAQGMSGSWTPKPEAGNSRGQRIFQTTALRRAAIEGNKKMKK